MSTPLPVRYYFGTTNNAVMGVMSPYESGIQISSDYGEHCYTFKDMTLRPAVGKIHPVIELENGARIELMQREVPAWVKPQNFLENAVSNVWQLESKLPLVFASLIVTVCVLLAALRFGVPAASDAIALRLPTTTLASLGDKVEAQLLDETETTQISKEKQQRIRALYDQYVAHGDSSRIRFVGGARYDANAFALPNGTIFITDELIDIAQHDHEILAVLAHEQGHVVKKHSLRQALNMLGISTLITFISGDISDFATTLPTLMLSMSYSRDFEFEADDYAKVLFEEKRLDTRHLSNMLLRLEASHYEHEDDDSTAVTPSGKLVELFSTHPTMAQRTMRINGQKEIITIANNTQPRDVTEQK